MARARGGSRSQPEVVSPAPAEQPQPSTPAPTEAVPAPAQPTPAEDLSTPAEPPVAPAPGPSEQAAPAPEQTAPAPAPAPGPLEAAPEANAYSILDEAADDLQLDEGATQELVPPEPASPTARGSLSVDEERRGVQAVAEATLHAQHLAELGHPPAFVEAMTGIRLSPDGFDIADPDAVASAAGRGPFFNTVTPELEQHPAGRSWLATGALTRSPLQQGQGDGGNPAARGRPFVSRFRNEQPAPFTRAFAEHLPHTRAALEAEFRRMLPADVAVRLANRITLYGHTADEVVSAPNAFNPTAPWILAVALERSPATAKIKGFHGIAAHILRQYGPGGLYTRAEWQLLLDRAEKEDMLDELQNEPIADGEQSLWDFYLDAYARHGAERQREYMDQELVGRLAEH